MPQRCELDCIMNKDVEPEDTCDACAAWFRHWVSVDDSELGEI